VPTGEATAQPIDLSLDDAIQRGLRNNLGVILSGTLTESARGARLTEMQALLPSVDFKAQENLAQVDLPAEGLRIPGFPKVIGPSATPMSAPRSPGRCLTLPPCATTSPPSTTSRPRS